MSAYALMPMSEVILQGLRLPYSYALAQFLTQGAIAAREASGWFLLIWLLQLHESFRLVRSIRIVSVVGIVAATADGALAFLYPDAINAATMQIADAILTVPALLFESIPVILVSVAIVKRNRLDSARWLVAILASLNALVYWITNITIQGVRYTHWTIADKIGATLFTVAGNRFDLGNVLRTLLFVSIVYAVVHYTIESRRRRDGRRAGTSKRP